MGQKNDARKSGARKVRREKWVTSGAWKDISGARNVRCETSGAQSGE